jgi:hypothetical protein
VHGNGIAESPLIPQGFGLLTFANPFDSLQHVVKSPSATETDPTRGIIALLGLIAPGCLFADEISLDLGGGVKMEFVWIPLPGEERKASVQIGDFTDAHSIEPVKEVTAPE